MKLMTSAWQPCQQQIDSARITHFMSWLADERDLIFDDYNQLWQWSVSDIETFWRAVWDFFGIPATNPVGRVLASADMPGAEWFPGVQLNYVEQVFKHVTDQHPAIISSNERDEYREISWTELQRQVAALSSSLRAIGVDKGDRVVAFMPNIPETVVALLAVASIGAIWSACAPDMGKLAIQDRFRQIEPKVMIAVDGYQYSGKAYDRRELLKDIVAELPGVTHVVLLPYQDHTATLEINGVVVTPWCDATAGNTPLEVTPVPFDHPLWIVYSSGTTGLPKPIVHSQGGIVIEHVKLAGLHLDLHPGDRFHWYSSTGWIMWNLQAGGLLVGSTICLFDGNPGYPDMHALWRFVSRSRVNFFGAGAAYFMSCQKANIEPGNAFDLSSLRAVGSTGSPLPPEGYRWILDHVGEQIWINALSGGTDFAGCFVAGVPTLPVYLGEMQCRCLGAKVEAFDEAGQPLIDAVGELVCTAPMPSMPLYFWKDTGNVRYRDSYFDVYPGTWRHGDWIMITSRGGAIIYGRSDATINRHGIRMGTSELYRAVEDLPEVLDSLVVDLEFLGRESYMPLFVVLQNDVELTDALVKTIKDRIRVAMSARHVPNDVYWVPAVPRTLSGKKLELPIKKLLLGYPLEKCVSRDSMSNPDSLDWFIEYAARREVRFDDGNNCVVNPVG